MTSLTLDLTKRSSNSLLLSGSLRKFFLNFEEETSRSLITCVEDMRYDFKTKFHRKKYRGYFEYWEETVQTGIQITRENIRVQLQYMLILFFSIKNYPIIDRNTWKIKN